MPVDPPFSIYRDQLTSLYHGLALWNPSPPKTIYNRVSIGDVGYIREGVFIRMFNVILPWDHESNRTLDEPEPYESLDCGPFTKVLEVPLKTQEHYSRYVSAETNDGNALAKDPDNAEGVTYNCRGHGALLLLPHGGRRADIIRTKAFADYIRDHVVSWFAWAQKNQQGVERMEDLILVSGCTLVSSWAAAAFVYNTMEAKISLARRSRSDGGECFIWANIRGAVEYHDSNIEPQCPPTTPDQCVFVRGFRAKRVLFWTKPMRAAAEPRPDDPDNNRDDEIQVSRVPEGPKDRDPLIGILDYIVEKCFKDAKAEDIIAIAHDDDLRLIKDVEILTADAIEEFLREKQMPLLVKNGAAILRDPHGPRQVTVERLGNTQSHTPQFGSSQMTAEKNEGQIQQEAHPPLFHRLVKAPSMPELGDRQSPTTQLGSLLASGTSQMIPQNEAFSSSAHSPNLVRLIVISDFACPWCFIANRELQIAIAQCSNLPITFEVEYRPFMLHNTYPTEPIDKNEFVGRKIGRERWEACKVMATERGEAVGINFSFTGPVSWTIPAHRLMTKAYEIGGPAAQAALITPIFRAYYEDDLDISDPDVLADAVEEAAIMSKDEALDFVKSDECLDKVNHQVNEARAKGVTGVPFTIIGGKWAVSGGQSAPVFVKIFNKLAELKASGSPPSQSSTHGVPAVAVA